MISIDNIIHFVNQLETTNNIQFSINEKNHLVHKKNMYQTQYTFNICSSPNINYPIIAKSSYLTLLIFFDKATLIIEGNRITCLPYTIVFIKKDCDYCIEKETKEDIIFIIDFKHEFFDSVTLSQIADCPIFYDLLSLEDINKEYLVFDYKKNTAILSSLNIFLDELISNHNKIHQFKNCKLMLIILLSQLDRNHISFLVINSSSMMITYDRGKILKYLSDHFATATLSSTAEYFNFHPAYFSALFKKLFYTSFSKKLLSLKLEHAKRLLITTNFNTQDIMHCVGFNDKSYFFKCFKSSYNMTPIQYRNANKIIYL